MTRVLGGSVVMRMLLPPLLTVVVDRSSAPAGHGSDDSVGLLYGQHEELPAMCQAMGSVVPRPADMRVSYTAEYTACGRFATASHLAELLRQRWMTARMA